MSLLDDNVKNCCIMTPTDTEDGAGGVTTTWAEGTAFKAYPAITRGIEAVVAEARGLPLKYSVLVAKTVDINHNDVFKDKDTGDTYRVTSQPNATPTSASFNLQVFDAERWDMT